MKLMRDLTSPRVMALKAGLFVVAGVMSAGLLAIKQRSLFDAAACVLVFCIGAWCLCRAYYFAFYVIQRYCDPQFRYAGIMSAVKWVMISLREKEKMP